MSRYHSHHAQCLIYVASHSPSKKWEDKNLGPGRYELTDSVVSCSVDEGAMGTTAQVTLVPRKPYREFIFPGDHISIYFSVNGEPVSDFGVVGKAWRASSTDEDRVLMGVIDAVRQSTTVDRSTGAVQVRVSISCTGLNKAFTATQIYYNEMLGPLSLFGASLPGLSTLTKNIPLMGTPATMARAIALAYLGFGGQFLLPESWPGGSEGERRRRERLNRTLDRAYKIEQDLGFTNVRLGKPGGVQRKGLIQTIRDKYRGEADPRSLASVIDLFSYVEDHLIDGRVQNTPTHDLTGSVWGLMQENSNPSMNEMFLSLLPPKSEEKSTKEKSKKSKSPAKDEWGKSPHYAPCLVLREYPFSTSNDVYGVPTRLGGERKIQFGDVFFSSRDNPAFVPILQKPPATPVRRSSSGSYFIADLVGENVAERFVDRIRIRPEDVIQETIGTSDNDLRNFWMISQTLTVLSHQRYVLLRDGLIPMFLPESIKRFGLRMEDIQTKLMHSGLSESRGKNAAFDFLIRSLFAQDVWKQHMPYYLAGTMQIPGMPKARRGMVLDILAPRNESYYVEGVAHEWSHPGSLSTSLTLTRGQPSGYDKPERRFAYAPPDPIKIYPSFVEKAKPRKEASTQPVRYEKGLSPADVPSMSLQTGVREDLYRQAYGEALKTKKNVLDVLSQKYPSIMTPGRRKHVESLLRLQPVPPEIPVKEDRARAGRSPWVEQENVGKMYDNIRRGES